MLELQNQSERLQVKVQEAVRKQNDRASRGFAEFFAYSLLTTMHWKLSTPKDHSHGSYNNFYYSSILAFSKELHWQ